MRILKYIAFVLTLIIGINQELQAAAVLELNGQYSLEGVWMRNSRLDGSSGKFYFLNQLRLKPEIKVRDGLSVHGRFDMLTNPWSNTFQYKAGSFWGVDKISRGSSLQSFIDPGIDVTHLYFSWSNEFVKLMGGRLPLDFGAGLLFDAGDEHLDHFADHLDGIGVEFKAGNLSIRPIFGILSKGLYGTSNVYRYLLNLQYELVDSKLLFDFIGVITDGRSGSKPMVYGPLVPLSLRDTFIQDKYLGTSPPPPSQTDSGLTSLNDSWSTYHLGTFVKKDFSIGTVKLEVDFVLGRDTGIPVDSQGNALAVSGYGAIAEFMTHPGSWQWGFKAGYLSGDDPETTDKYEGFIAHRNYPVGMLMFNHAIGHQDTIGGSYRVYPPTANESQGYQQSNNRNNLPDMEYLTNAIFIAPHLTKSLFKNGYLTTDVIWAKLVTPSQWTDATNLGFEIDLGFMYKSSQYLTLGLETGWLFPGAGFIGDSRRMVYGVQANAIISF